MITFLPYPCFLETALCLDRQRLGKQRVEAKMILEIRLGKSSRWANHPAVKMWAGFEAALAFYGETLCLVWKDRGYVDNLREFFSWNTRPGFPIPGWMGTSPIHTTHRAALLAKDPEWYGKFGWHETPKIEYWWPVPLKSNRHGEFKEATENVRPPG